MNKNSWQHKPLPTKLPITPFLASVSATSTVHVSKLPGQDFLVCYCFKRNLLAVGATSQSEGIPCYRHTLRVLGGEPAFKRPAGRGLLI